MQSNLLDVAGSFVLGRQLSKQLSTNLKGNRFPATVNVFTRVHFVFVRGC
jgi:hypothetical protein